MLTPNPNQVPAFKGPASKDAARNHISNKVNDFLNSGKSIHQVAKGVSGEKGGPKGIVINNKQDCGRVTPKSNGVRNNQHTIKAA